MQICKSWRARTENCEGSDLERCRDDGLALIRYCTYSQMVTADGGISRTVVSQRVSELESIVRKKTGKKSWKISHSRVPFQYTVHNARSGVRMRM